MAFQQFVYQRKRNKYSTPRFIYLVVPHRLWRHNYVTTHVMNVYWWTSAASANHLEQTRAADHWQCCQPMERSFVWQPVCEKSVDILSTHSKNSSLGLVLAVDGVERWFQNFVIPDRVFFPVSIGARSEKIQHETWELWSQIKWHVFYGPRCI